MRYVKGRAVAEDAFARVEGDEPVPGDVSVIVSADWLLGVAPADIAGRTAALGIAWPNDRPVDALEPYLPSLAVVALEFPVFRDGRAYTQARQLRERYRFAGEIRATGDVLRDQFLFMARAGFDAFEVKKDKDAEAFAAALHEFTVGYFATSGTRAPLARTRFQS